MCILQLHSNTCVIVNYATTTCPTLFDAMEHTGLILQLIYVAKGWNNLLMITNCSEHVTFLCITQCHALKAGGVG